MVMGNNPFVNGKHHSLVKKILWDSSHMKTLAQKLDDLMKEQGFNYKSLSKASRLGETAVRDIVVGRVRSPKVSTLLALAKTLKVPSQYLTSYPAMVPVMGYVGAGAEVFTLDDEDTTLEEVACPTGYAPDNIVALRVRGDSMEPAIDDGDLVFYDSDSVGVPDECIGKKCVVKLVNNGVLVKRVMRGSNPGHYHLLSINQKSNPIIDAEVLWACKVIDIRPT